MFRFFLILTIGFMVSSCGCSYSTPPDAEQSITLSWTPPTENNDESLIPNSGDFALNKFVIYFSDDVINIRENSINVDSVNNSHIINGDTFPSSGTWYFGVTAVNNLGFESELSNIVSTSIVAKKAMRISLDTNPFKKI